MKTCINGAICLKYCRRQIFGFFCFTSLMTVQMLLSSESTHPQHLKLDLYLMQTRAVDTCGVSSDLNLQGAVQAGNVIYIFII